MAYLDRPLQAGYFLFPDLSVRHEGRYRLTFNLYEETKDDKDKDTNTPDAEPLAPGTNSATGGSFDFRMEVKSKDFVVYSAKKFPGLSESTQLSRMVAEQGCRVRIRRDVRMRRRDDKAGGDYGNAEDEFARRRRTATPDTRPDPYRARSMSGSVERTPYSADARRPSVADYPPQFSAQSSSSGGHLQFLGGNSNSQYPSQSQNFAQPPSVPPSPSYPPSQGTSFSTQSSYPPPPPPAYATASASSYVPINPSPRRDSEHHDYRSSTSSVNNRLPRLDFPPLQMSQQMPQSTVSSHDRPVLPPLQIEANSVIPSRLPIPSPTSLSAPRQNSLSAPVSAGFVHPSPPQYAGTKRPRDKSFRVESDLHRFQDGAREQSVVEDLDPIMVFKRADGTKKIVPHV